MTNFEKVELFMKTFGQEVKKSASLSSANINNLRLNLIKEEFEELKKALNKEKYDYKLENSITNKDSKIIIVDFKK